MFYSCAPAGSRGASVTARRAKSSAKRPGRLIVDLHCHVLTPAAEEVVRPAMGPASETLMRFANEATREVNRAQAQGVRGKLTDIATRLKDMDRMGVDIQAISPAPPQYYYWTEPDMGREACRLINDNIANIVAQHPDRLVGLGTVPMQAPEFAVVELERLVKDLGLRGVEICTNVAGQELSDPKFRPFFAKAEELGILIFMHPNGFTEGQRLSEHYFINVIGNPLDSTVAVSHLIFGGVLQDHPRLKICVAHGGGFLPAYAGRMDHAHGARSDCRLCIKRKPTSYLKRLYFDTIVFAPEQLEHLVRQYGADHIVMGTDYPFDMGMYTPVEFVDGIRKFTAAEKAQILGGNAAKLLKLSASARASGRSGPAARRRAG